MRASDDFTATEVKAGALVLVSVLILAGLVAAIRGWSFGEEPTHSYYATFEDVGGLNVGADVRFGGVAVGRVAAVELDPEDRTRIRVRAVVPETIPVNGDSVASVRQVSLTSELHLEISTGSLEAEVLEGGAVLPTAGVAGLFDIPDIDGVIQRLETVLDDVVALLGVDRLSGPDAPEEMVDLATVARRLAELLESSTAAVGEVRSFLGDDGGAVRELVGRTVELEEVAIELMRELDAVVRENREPVHLTVTRLARLAERASESLDTLAAQLEVSLGHLEDTTASASELLGSQRTTVDEILANLEQTSRNLRRLSQTLADDPGALIWRGRPAGRRVTGDDQ